MVKSSIEDLLYKFSQECFTASTWLINQRYNWLYKLHKWAIRNNTPGEYTIPYGALKGKTIYNKPGKFSSLDVFSLDELLLQVLFRRITCSDFVVWDVGANIGLHTILLSDLAKVVVAFEPDARHAKALKKNLTLNGITTVRVVTKALYSKDGPLFFDNTNDNSSKAHIAEQGARIEGIRGDTLISDNPYLLPAIIKIDVEGQAHNVLIGMGTYLKKARYVICELHNEEESHYVYAILKSNGFRVLGQNMLWSEVYENNTPISVWDGHILAINEKYNDSCSY